MLDKRYSAFHRELIGVRIIEIKITEDIRSVVATDLSRSIEKCIATNAVVDWRNLLLFAYKTLRLLEKKGQHVASSNNPAKFKFVNITSYWFETIEQAVIAK